MHKAIAVISALMMGQATAAEWGSMQPLGAQTFMRPATNLTFSNNLVITADGVVTVPLDELTPAEQIEAMCAALSSLALGVAGVSVKRCGKPAP